MHGHCYLDNKLDARFYGHKCTVRVYSHFLFER